MTQQATTNTSPNTPTLQLLQDLQNQMAHGNWESAAHLAAQTIRSAVLQDPLRLPEAQDQLAQIWRVRGRINSAVRLYQSASRGYRALGMETESRRCLILVAEILLDAERAQSAQEAISVLGGGDDARTLRGRLYALQGDGYRLKGVASWLLRERRQLGADEWLVLALNEQLQGRTQRAAERLDQAMRLAAGCWDMWAMRRIERAQQSLHRGGQSA